MSHSIHCSCLNFTCTVHPLCVCMLCALGEFGDYDAAEHGTDYLDDSPLLENRVRDKL